MLVDARGLSRVYPMGSNDCVALQQVDLQIEAGEFVAIMGPSGSGKSTLMHLLGCLDRPTTGRYLLDGVEVQDLDDLERSQLRNRKIGFVFQSFHLLTDLDVLENVELPLVYAGVPAGERRARALALLGTVGLEHRTGHRPNEMSGGELQRVAIARALANEPPLLLADEPTGNLDSANGESILRLFSELHKRGTTVVLVTHDAQVAQWTQRVVRVHDGRIASDGAAPRRRSRERPSTLPWHEEA